ncbi:hypothetical protein [Sphingomicrobium nitratireducens]|uniref:hypothetical protein n=1 Tax=Sphingomicrobium nitratireducens TaxID=2964666 RepID=UPI0022403F22|nr:hypothetical protein [Sphingomicrobium nitratireducens]
MKRLLSALVGAAGLAASPALAADDPLFASDDVLQLTIKGPISTIAKNAAESTRPYDATLQVGAEALPIQLSARGLSRRNKILCTFPPLRVDLKAKAPDNSVMKGQKRLKLVTHCRDNSVYQQVAMREYAAYRLYNALTPESLRVRLANIRYVDPDGKEVATRYGFFIEDIDDLAKRMSGKEVEVARIGISALDTGDAARYELFQYMIGNTDWSMLQGPGGRCCHNSKLIGATVTDRMGLTPVPYDFDQSGLVDAPYAIPSEQLKIRSVRQRYYWGLCAHNGAVKRARPEFLAARGTLVSTLSSLAGLDAREKKKMQSYLDDFFDDISSEESLEGKLLKTCRS